VSNSLRGVHDGDNEVHLSFTAFSDFITRRQPRFLSHGHMHPNVETTIGGTWDIGDFGHQFLTLPDGV